MRSQLLRARFLNGQWLLRFLVLCIFWTGLGVLKIEDKMSVQILWQALLLSGLILIGALLERILDYQGDIYLLPAVQAIMVIGLVFLVRIDPDRSLRQFYWANLGLVLFYATLWGIRDYRKLGRSQYLWGLGAVVMLLLTLVFGVASGGATSWLNIAGFSFEPEELVKITLLLFLAGYFTEKEELLRVGTVQWWKFSLPDWRTLGPFLMMAAFVFGFLGAQKSLGTALVFYSMFVLLLYVVTERPLYLGISVPILALTGWLGYIAFAHVRTRIWTWWDPWVDTVGGGHQIAQSLFAIAGGGVFGTGLGNGIGAYQVPVASSDFIFSVIAEELGFAGAMAIIALFLVVILRAFAISMKAIDRFGQILAAGIGILVGVETLIILAGVTKLLPLTGIPLPWASLGGSSLTVHFLLLGVLSNISHATEVSISDMRAEGRDYAG